MKVTTFTRTQRSGLLCLVACALHILGSAHSFAADGVWTQTSSGVWSNTANWTSGTVADGTGSTAFFNTLDLSGPLTLSLDSARTLSKLSFADVNPTTAASIILSDNGDSANVLTLGTTPTITVGQLGTGSSVTISTILAGTAGITKNGPGSLVLTRANTYTGTTVLSGGSTTLDFSAAGAPLSDIVAAASPLSLAGSSTLSLTGGAGLTNTQTFASTNFASGLASIQVNPGASGSLSLNLGAITGNTGAQVRFSGTGSISGTMVDVSTLGVMGRFGASGTAVNSGFATFGLEDYAAINTGAVVSGSSVAGFYVTTNPSSATTVGNWSPTASASLGSGQRAATTTRFNSAAALTITLASGSLFTNDAILVTPNVGANNTTFTGAGVWQVIRQTSPTGSQQGTIWQNNTAGLLNFNAPIANGRDAGDNNFVVKAGAGTLVIGATNTYSGRLIVNEGTVSISSDGNLGAAGVGVTLDGGSLFGNGTFSTAAARGVTVATTGNLSASAGNTLTVDGAIGGNGRLTIGSGTLVGTGPGTANTTAIVGSGIVSVTGANFYLGGTEVTAGSTLRINGVNALGGGNYGGLTLSGGTLQYATTLTSGADLTLGGAGLTAGTPAITLPSGTSTIDTNGNNVTYSLPFGGNGSGSLSKVGTGSLTLAGANTYTGTSSVSGGSLNITGSLAGAATASSGGTLGGTGSISGTLTIASGGTLAPGASVGTLTVGNLALSSGSILNWEFNSSPANDFISVLNNDGLVINGGGLNLFSEGTATPWTTNGTYNLFGYTGLLGGTGTSALSILNSQPGKSYSFGSTGSFVTLTIADSGLVTNWAVDSDGSWTTPANWSVSVPDGFSDTVTFNTALTAPRTVTLDGSKSANSITFTSAGNGYTLAAGTGGSLSLGGTTPLIQNAAGSHSITAPLILSTSTSVDTASGTTLTLAGAISGAGTLTKTSAGTLDLTHTANTHAATTLNAGTLGFATVGSLGTGTLTLNGGALRWNTGSTSDISALTVALTANTTLDTNGNDVTLASPIGAAGAGGIIKAGSGTLTLSAANTHTGPTAIHAGTLSISSNASLGDPATGAGITLNGGTLASTADITLDNAGSNARVITVGASGGTVSVAASTTLTLNTTLAGAGALTKAGDGVFSLNSAGTFTNPVTISAGSVQISSGNTLSTTPVTANAANSVRFATGITAATIGNLTGTGGVTLTNADTTAVALSVGDTSSYSTAVALSGAGSLVKIGSGTVTLTGASTYAGNTTISAGTLAASTGGSITGGAITVNGLSTGKLLVNGGSIIGTTGFVGNGSNGFEITSGSATFSGSFNMNDHANSGNFIKVGGGTVSAASMNLGRSSLNLSTEPTTGQTTNGLYQTAGSLSISGNLDLGVNTGANSSVSARLDGGTTTVGGALTLGLNNGGRWSILDVNGGSLTQSGSAGTFIGGPLIGNAVLTVRAGTATLEKVTFGQGTNTGTSILDLQGGELYIGSGGIVQGSANITATFRSSGGTLGAAADWSSSIPLTLTGTTTIKTADAANVAHNITLSGGITGSGTFNQSGSGILTISGSNSYTGVTNVGGSTTLEVTADNALGSATGSTTVASGSALRLNNVIYTIAEPLFLNGTGVSGGGALTNSGTSSFAGPVTAATNATIHAGGGQITFSGGLIKDGTTLTLAGGGTIIVSGTGISGASASSDLVVDGTTLVVNAASNYNGPTTLQNSGTLVANAAVTTTQVTVNNGSTLSGTGSVSNGAGLVYLNGALIVGDSTLGAPVASQFEISGTGTTVLGVGSSLMFDLFTRGGDLTGTLSASDRLKLFGTLDASTGGTLVLNANGLSSFAAGDMWTLFDLTSGGSITGTLALDYSSLGLGGGLTGSLNQSTGVFSITTTMVPEPSRALLLLAGLLGLAMRRRRQLTR